MVGGLLVSMGIGTVMATAALIGGHGFWWAIVNYSAGGTITFAIMAMAVLRHAQKQSASAVQPPPELSGAMYQVQHVSLKGMGK